MLTKLLTTVIRVTVQSVLTVDSKAEILTKYTKTLPSPQNQTQTPHKPTPSSHKTTQTHSVTTNGSISEQKAPNSSKTSVFK